jgi:hypothetical protein
MDALRGDGVKKWNAVGMHNLGIDVRRLLRFARDTKVDGLCETLTALRQLTTLFVSGSKRLLTYMYENVRKTEFLQVD